MNEQARKKSVKPVETREERVLDKIHKAMEKFYYKVPVDEKTDTAETDRR